MDFQEPISWANGHDTWPENTHAQVANVRDRQAGKALLSEPSYRLTDYQTRRPGHSKEARWHRLT